MFKKSKIYLLSTLLVLQSGLVTAAPIDLGNIGDIGGNLPRPTLPVVPPIDPNKIKDIPLEKNGVYQLSKVYTTYFKENNFNANSFLNGTIAQLGINGSYETNAYPDKQLNIVKGQPILTHTIRWKPVSPVVQTECAIIQVSSFPFMDSQNLKNPSLLEAEKLSCVKIWSDGYRYDDINFDKLENYKPFWATYKPLVIQPIDRTPNEPIHRRAGNLPEKIPANKFSRGNPHSSWIDIKRPTFPNNGPSFQSDYLKFVENNRVNLPKDLFKTFYYYVRVIPVKKTLTDYVPVGKPSKSAVIYYNAEPSNGNGVVLHDGQPKVDHKKFHRIKPDHFNFYCFYKTTVDILDPFTGKVWINKNTVFNTCASSDDDSWLDDIADAIGEMWDAITGFIDFISKVYDTIKATVTMMVANALGCTTDTCKAIIGGILNAALVAAGLPPELPNSSELMSMGKDYLAEQIASGTGVPVDIVKEGMKQMENAVNEAKNTTAAGNSFILEEGYQYRPAILELTITKDASDIGIMNPSVLKVENLEGVFKTMVIPLPVNVKKIPGTYSLPVYLQPEKDFRGWYNTHMAAIDRFGQMDINGFVSLEQQSLQQYIDFYNQFNQTLRFKVSMSNKLITKDKILITCSTNACTYQSL